MDKAEAQNYLQSLLNQNFRVHVSDGRLFWGQFKCTDQDKNIVLAHAHEYRQPAAGVTVKGSDNLAQAPVVGNLTPRFLGLIVIPGHHIVKMEREEVSRHGIV